MSPATPDGVLSVAAFELPPSSGWSDEARRVFLRRLRGPAVSASTLSAPGDEVQWQAAAAAFRSAMEDLHRRLLRGIAEAFPCSVEPGTLSGVPVRWVLPASGNRHPGRVLVNLHGGAFVGGAEHAGLVESLPIASLGGYRVCVVDYRQGWEHRFPAASEDVVTVLEALRREVPSSSIGVFGYSAGGMLAAQTSAMLQHRGLPQPGALALCSAGAGGSGDAAVLAPRMMGLPVAGAEPDDGTVALGGHVRPARFGYAAGIEPGDPLFSPVGHPEVLRHFPPTVLLTGTRSFDCSSVLLTHRALLQVGVPAELHCWEGMWHCFAYNHRMPEAEDAFASIIAAFDRWLA